MTNQIHCDGRPVGLIYMDRLVHLLALVCRHSRTLSHLIDVMLISLMRKWVPQGLENLPKRYNRIRIPSVHLLVQ